jgi:K+-transporting ATPase ATPase A chain
MMVTYAIERLQAVLPLQSLLNPQKLAAVAPDLAMNTAASFTTNTNWQAYVPEATMSYLTQMVTLAYHNFASAAVGIALAIAFVRGIAGLGRYNTRNTVGLAAGKPDPRSGTRLAGSRAKLQAV